MDQVSQQIIRRVRQENNRILGEMLIAIGVGVVSIVIIFGGLFYFTWLFLTMRVYRIGSDAPLWWASSITCSFMLGAILAAWRRHDPMQNAQAMDPTLQDVQLGVGYALGVPVVNRQSIAGFASLMTGGFANLFDAWDLWRSRIRAGSAVVMEAARILALCRQGLGTGDIRDPQAAGLLLRLKLIKVTRVNEKAALQTTIKGDEVLAARSNASIR